MEHQTRESIFVSRGTHRVDDTSAWRAARRLDGPFSRCLRRSSTWEVTQYRVTLPGFHVYRLDDEKLPVNTRGVFVTGEDNCINVIEGSHRADAAAGVIGHVRIVGCIARRRRRPD